MASDNKKAKADPAPKSEADAKDKSTAGEAVSKTEDEDAETGHHSYRENWNAIYAKKKREEEKVIIRAREQEKGPE